MNFFFKCIVVGALALAVCGAVFPATAAPAYKDTFFGSSAACSASNPCRQGQVCDTASSRCVSATTDFFGAFGITQTGAGADAAKYGPLRFWSNAINMLLGLLGISAVGAIVYGGMKYIASAGEADKVKSASKTLVYATLGLIVIALAWVIGYVIVNSVAGMLK